MDIEEDLEILKERKNTLSISKPLSRSTSSKASTSKRKYNFPILSNTEENILNYYFIEGIVNEQRHKILINTGQDDNYINTELVLENEIIKAGHVCPGLPDEIITISEEIEKEIIIGGIPLVIPFKIYQGKESITLGINWYQS